MLKATLTFSGCLGAWLLIQDIEPVVSSIREGRFFFDGYLRILGDMLLLYWCGRMLRGVIRPA